MPERLAQPETLEQTAAPRERVLAAFRPSWKSVLLRTAPWLVGWTLLCVISAWVHAQRAWVGPAGDERPWWVLMWPLLVVSLGVVLLVGVRAVMAVMFSRYELTDRRGLARHGWLSRSLVEVPLDRVQDVAVTQTLGQRLLGIGNLGVATSSGGYALVWSMIDKPHERLVMLRCTGSGSGGGGAGSTPAASDTNMSATPQRTHEERSAGGPTARTTNEHEHGAVTAPRIIGLAGGIGSGKSFVARVFAELGSPRCMVIDSDRLAREALDRPEVRAQLVQWWGESVLRENAVSGEQPSSSGPLIDRAKVAAIVFDQPQERQRLERLIHPLIRQSRQEMIAAAIKTDAPPQFVLVDAPLLFEAGLDRECDAVVFVDAPRLTRLERVRTTRAWSEAELARREASQWSVDDKRAKAEYVINNGPDANPANLREQAREILRMISEQSGEIRRSSPQSPAQE